MSQDVSKHVGQQIKRYRKLKKMTQKQLGEKIGVKHNTVSSYENGTNEPDQEMIFAIADALEVSINDLFPDPKMKIEKRTNHRAARMNRLRESGVDYVAEVITSPFVKLPVFGQISCRNGKIIFEEPIDFETVPRDWLNGGEYITVVATGNSMTGSKIFEGDRLLIRLQDHVENGEIAAIVIGEETLLKKVYKKGDTLILESSNETYETKFIDLTETKNVKILGKLKKSITSF